ncbi:FUSC family protein [Propionibacteriaceae bacterium G57]|uniref:FUSC family protein n=1 Tax=Aestuariimicrobium sp. G57 TaxID=3418485 RepID=UPI003DA6CF19
MAEDQSMEQILRAGWRSVAAYIRSRARSGWTRARGALVPNTQAAIFATIAWLICRYGLNEPHPIFAAIACYLAMGFSRNRQPRRVLEIGLGATFGVFVGEMVGRFLGFGWWQLLLIMMVTPLVARFIDRADLMTFQSTINAMVVASMISIAAGVPGQSGISRWTDALIGSGVALVAALVLPRSITTRPRRYAATAVQRSADALEAIGKGLVKGDGGQIRSAVGHLAVVRHQVTDGSAAQSSAADLALINPRFRGDRVELAEIDRLLTITSRMHTSLTMLTRQARSMVGEQGAVPVPGKLVLEVATAMRHLSSAIDHFTKPVLARNEAMQVAADLTPLELAAKGDWRTTALVSLLRAVVVDLLLLTGLSLEQARATLEQPGTLDPDRVKAQLPEEHGSSLWGTVTMPAVQVTPSDPEG